MADEINKRRPNLKPYETAIDRMGANARRPTGEMIKEQAAINKAIENRNIAQQQHAEMMAKKSFYTSDDPDGPLRFIKASARYAKSIDLHTENLQTMRASRFQVAENLFISEVKNLAQSNVNQISTLDQARASVAARELIASGKFTESSVAKGLARLPGQIAARQEKVVAATSDRSLEGLSKYMSAAEQLESSKIKYHNLKVAEKEIQRLGLDSASVIKSSYNLKDSILSGRVDDSLVSRVASGATGSMKEETSKLKEAEDRFLEAQNKFADALASGEEDVEAFKKAVVDSTKSLEEQKKLVDEMKRQGAGNGGGMDRFLRGIGAAGSALQVGGNIALNTLVNADSQQMALRAGFARFHNQNFMDHYQATQGDMMALSLVESQTAGRSGQFGSEQQGQATGAVAAQAAGGVLKTGASVLKGVTSGLKTGGIFGGIGGGAEAALGNAESMAASATDLAKGLTAGQAGLTGASVRRDLNIATNEITAAARQEFFNTSMGNFRATVGFGGRSSDVFSSLQKNRRAFAELGLQAEDVQSIYQTGVQSMGADFTRLGTGGMAALAAQSGRVQEAGVTSAQDYISRIGQMSQTGGGIREVEDVLANAVARGVDNAKSFGAMVEAVSSISGQSAAMGVNTSGSAARALLASMDASRGNGLNEQLNLNAAQQQARVISGMTGDTGLNFGTVMEQAQLSQAFPNIRAATRTNLMGVDIEQIRQIQSDIESGNTQAALTNAKTLGISSAFFSDDGSVNKSAIAKAIEIKQQKVSSQGAAFMSAEEAARAGRGEVPLSNAESDARVMAIGVTAIGSAQLSGKGFSRGQLKGPEGDRAAEFQITQAQATGKATMGEAGEASASLAQIAATMQSLANTLQPMASAKTAAQGAAEMKLDTSAFDTSVKTFEQAVQLLISKLGEKGGPVQPPMPGTRPMIKRGNP